MKKFKITVNGKAYEVEVEEMGGTPVAAPAPQASAPAASAASLIILLVSIYYSSCIFYISVFIFISFKGSPFSIT